MSTLQRSIIFPAHKIPLGLPIVLEKPLDVIWGEWLSAFTFYEDPVATKALVWNGEQWFYKEQNNYMSFDWQKSWHYLEAEGSTGQTLTKYHHLLARALGKKAFIPGSKIVDATCGTGEDTLLLLFLGAQLQSYERSAMVSLLLCDAFRRCLSVPGIGEILSEKWQFFPGSTVDGHQLEKDVDYFLYYDPMYHFERQKKSLPRKEMQILREEVGMDQDKNEFLNNALSWPIQRLVVKRPLRQLPMHATQLNASFKGKMVAYDLYLPKHYSVAK